MRGRHAFTALLLLPGAAVVGLFLVAVAGLVQSALVGPDGFSTRYLNQILDRPDYHELPTLGRANAGTFGRADLRGRVHKAGQRTFCVHRPAAVQNIIFHPNRNLARHRVDVPEQHYLFRSPPNHTDRVPRFINQGLIVPKRFHASHEPFGCPIFLSRGPVL